MADPSLYLFDGHNLLHAGAFGDPRELRDALASFVALKGARGVLVFDGVGEDERHGALEVRYTTHADAVLERLAADHRSDERVCLVSSDTTLGRTAGQEVAKVASKRFLSELHDVQHREGGGSSVLDRVDDATRARLERLRRGDQ